MAPVSKVDVVTASGSHVLSRLALSSSGKFCCLISVFSNAVTSGRCPPVANTVTSGAVLQWQNLSGADLQWRTLSRLSSCDEHCHVWSVLL